MGQEYPHAGLVGGCVDVYVHPDIFDALPVDLANGRSGRVQKKPLYR